MLRRPRPWIFTRALRWGALRNGTEVFAVMTGKSREGAEPGCGRARGSCVGRQPSRVDWGDVQRRGTVILVRSNALTMHVRHAGWRSGQTACSPTAWRQAAGQTRRQPRGSFPAAAVLWILSSDQAASPPHSWPARTRRWRLGNADSVSAMRQPSDGCCPRRPPGARRSEWSARPPARPAAFEHDAPAVVAGAGEVPSYPRPHLYGQRSQNRKIRPVRSYWFRRIFSIALPFANSSISLSR
jgi:hypothetical protein